MIQTIYKGLDVTRSRLCQDSTKRESVIFNTFEVTIDIDSRQSKSTDYFKSVLISFTTGIPFNHHKKKLPSRRSKLAGVRVLKVHTKTPPHFVNEKIRKIWQI